MFHMNGTLIKEMFDSVKALAVNLALTSCWWNAITIHYEPLSLWESVAEVQGPTAQEAVVSGMWCWW